MENPIVTSERQKLIEKARRAFLHRIYTASDPLLQDRFIILESVQAVLKQTDTNEDTLETVRALAMLGSPSTGITEDQAWKVINQGIEELINALAEAQTLDLEEERHSISDLVHNVYLDPETFDLNQAGLQDLAIHGDNSSMTYAGAVRYLAVNGCLLSMLTTTESTQFLQKSLLPNETQPLTAVS